MIWWSIVACIGQTERAQKLLLQSLGKDVFVATYQEVENRSIQLHQGIEQFCENPMMEDIALIQNLWWSAREPWKQMEILKFGPYIEEPYRLGPKIDFWPVRPETIDELLVGELELTEDAMRNYGASSKGFPALEYLLYGEHDLVADRYCQYLSAASSDLVFQTGEMYRVWDPNEGNYLSNLTEPGEDKIFASVEQALTEIVNRLGHTVANIRADKLRKPLGLDVGSIQVDKMESPYSHRSLQDIRDNLEGIKNVYYGVDGGIGISDYLQDKGLRLDEEFQSHLENCIVATEALHNQGSLAETLIIDSDGVLYLVELLGGLQSYIQIELLSALSLWLTFNDSDGD